MTLVTAVDLASLLGTTKETVRRWVRDDGLQPVSRDPLQFDVDAARAWRESVLAERAALIGPEAFAKAVGGTSKHTVRRVAIAAGLQQDARGRFDKAALETAWAAEADERVCREGDVLSKKIIALINRIIRRRKRERWSAAKAARVARPLGRYEIKQEALAVLVGVTMARVLGWWDAKLIIAVQDVYGLRTFDLEDLFAQIERGRVRLKPDAAARLEAEIERRRDLVV